MHIKTLVLKAKLFGRKLDRIRRAHSDEGFEWFRYPILDNIRALDGLLKGDNRAFFGSIRKGSIADLGAADGDLSFFLERQGFDVDLVDTAHANYNRMQGARTLKTALKSNVAIHDIDLDARFELPRTNYDLVLLLGTLYHLKNPYYVLEHLANVSRYLFLSTRIARFSRAVGLDYSAEPMAYLLDPEECNNDATNFWIFSETGLKRLVRRCGWEIRDYASFGAVGNSTPQDPDRDERAWMFLESTLEAHHV